MYQSRDVISPSISTGANNQVALQWQDPEDLFFNGEAMMEWKGTLVVCKQGTAPINADDGIVICDSRVKNQYKNSPLLTNIGGANHYYGIFPYTKDYVVNVGSANILFCLGQLDGTSWADIAACSASGLAQQWWKVGDEKVITLSGSYNISFTAQIAGFAQDDLADGSGKAGITFVSKEVFLSVEPNSKEWPQSSLRTPMASVKSSMPGDLRGVIKKVDKKYINDATYTAPKYGVSQDEIFVLSSKELGIAASTYVPDEGVTYAIFPNQESRRKKNTNGESVYYWTRSPALRGSSTIGDTIGINGESGSSFTALRGNRAVCIGFCV